MASYQAIDTDLRAVEDKVDFIMNLIKIATPSPLVGAPPRVVSLLDMYTESRRAGLTIDTTPTASEEVTDATNAPADN